MKGLLLMSILLGNPDGHHRRAALTYGSLPGSTGELVIAKLIVVVSNLSGTREWSLFDWRSVWQNGGYFCLSELFGLLGSATRERCRRGACRIGYYVIELGGPADGGGRSLLLKSSLIGIYFIYLFVQLQVIGRLGDLCDERFIN